MTFVCAVCLQEEWVGKIRELVAMHSEGESNLLYIYSLFVAVVDVAYCILVVPCAAPLKYATVEIFYGPRPGIRVNGNIGTELMVHLSGCAGKTFSDDRGW